MSHPYELASLIGQSGATLRRGEVTGFDEDGMVLVAVPGLTSPVLCLVLNPGAPGSFCSGGDTVMLWLQGEDAGVQRGVVMGRIGPHIARVEPLAGTGAAHAERPKTLVLEAQGDIVLRNGASRIRLGEQGDVEIVCNSFATRSQRLLRLLAPMIKLN